MDQLETCPMELEEGNALGELMSRQAPAPQASSPPKTQPLPFNHDTVVLDECDDGFVKTAVEKAMLALEKGQPVLIMPRKAMERPSTIEKKAGFSLLIHSFHRKI